MNAARARRQGETFKVRKCFFARREAEPENAWSSYRIAQAIVVLIGNNQSFSPVLVAGCLYDRVAHTRAMDVDSHRVTIGLWFQQTLTLPDANQVPNVC